MFRVAERLTGDLVPDAIWSWWDFLVQQLFLFFLSQNSWGLSVEQDIGIIVASTPALRQLFTVFKLQRNVQRSHSSERPFAGANHFITSPLRTSFEGMQFEGMQFDKTPSLDSPVSNITEQMEPKQKVDSANKVSPTTSMTWRLGCLSLSAEKLQGVKEDHNAKARECTEKWEERRESMPTLGNLAVLGYSCEIEGGSPRLET